VSSFLTAHQHIIGYTVPRKRYILAVLFQLLSSFYGRVFTRVADGLACWRWQETCVPGSLVTVTYRGGWVADPSLFTATTLTGTDLSASSDDRLDTLTSTDGDVTFATTTTLTLVDDCGSLRRLTVARLTARTRGVVLYESTRATTSYWRSGPQRSRSLTACNDQWRAVFQNAWILKSILINTRWVLCSVF